MDIQDFIARLDEATDVGGLSQEIDKLIDREQHDTLKALVTALAESWQARINAPEIVETEHGHYTVDNYSWRYSSVLKKLFNRLAHGQVKQIELLITLLTLKMPERYIRVSEYAARIITDKSDDMMIDLLPQHIDINPELCAQIVQEIIIDGTDLSDELRIHAVIEQLKAQSHPLMTLPLKLLEHEAHIAQYRRRYTLTGASADMPYACYAAMRPIEDKAAHQPLQRVVDEAQETLMTQAFLNWAQQSNGITDAGQYLATETITDADLVGSDLLLKTGADCLSGATVKDVSIRVMDAKRVLSLLFSGAATGGAYNSGIGNSYARLAMWQSVAGLLGQAADTPITTLHDMMKQVAWYEVGVAVNNWFSHVAWDAMLIAFDQQAQMIHLLAATDTD